MGPTFGTGSTLNWEGNKKDLLSGGRYNNYHGRAGGQGIISNNKVGKRVSIGTSPLCPIVKPLKQIHSHKGVQPQIEKEFIKLILN